MPPRSNTMSGSKPKSGNGSSSKLSLGSGNTTSNGSQGGKKLSSLSSLQSTLKFSFPTASRSISTGTTTSKSDASLKSKSPEKDRELMPPPPPRLSNLIKNGSGSSSTASFSGLSAGQKRKSVGNGSDKKGKTKEVVIEVDDDDEIAFTGTSPSKIYKGPMDMWTDSYGPNSEIELAPGKARVAKVKSWLQEALHGCPMDHSSGLGMNSEARARVRKYKRILLLSGPAGAGKTTTIRVLSKEMEIDLLEWGEGADDSSLGSGLDRESASAKMISFLSRHSYSPLSMGDSKSSSTSHRPRLILLTGLPNLTHLPTRDAFHSALLSFCQSFTAASCPLVIVHSDAGSGGRAEESWLDRDRGGREGSLELLGKAVKEGPWCTEIDFIPIAPTFLTKALERVVSLGVPGTGWRPPKSALQLIALTSNGDLRSAVNSLQMLCKRANVEQGKTRKGRSLLDEDGSSPGSSQKRAGNGRGSRGGKGARLEVSDSLRAVLDAVSRKEQNLSLFHSLGKVLYNKRLGDPGEEKEDQENLAIIRALPEEEPLPTHLADFQRRKSLIQMDPFLATIPLDTSSFALWLHENAPKFTTTVDEASAAIEDLCRADIMKADDDIWQASPQAIAYALNLTVRGVLMALPSPVPRLNQKVTKPQFFDSFRKERDNLGKVDIASGYIARKAISASNVLAERTIDIDTHDEAAWGGLVSRGTLATEMIPMMIKIQSASRRPLLPSSVQSLALSPYLTYQSTVGQELTDKSEMEDTDDFDGSAAGEDGMGLLPNQAGVWDDMPEVAEKEDDGLEGDEIEDWD